MSVESPTVDEQVSRLAELVAGLRLDEDDEVETRSAGGYEACSVFLGHLQTTMDTLGVGVAPRSYRRGFSANYQALFPDEGRQYRVDIFEAAFERCEEIWVNGQKYNFSDEAMRKAALMHAETRALLDLFGKWKKSKPARQWLAGGRPRRSEVVACMQRLDIAWATFEEHYIGELIKVEGEARHLLTKAIEAERRLRWLEECMADVHDRAEYTLAQTSFVAQLARINAVANIERKGRDDLNVQVLERAQNILQRARAHTQASVDPTDAVAADLIYSYESIREYLRRASSHLERVDPQLSHNPCLRKHLVALEETWEVAARLLMNETLLVDFSGILRDICLAQQAVPSLAEMCQSCDVEFIMFLPRLMWIRFLTNPDADSSKELLRGFLPRRFHNDSAVMCAWDVEVAAFLRSFRDGVWSLLTSHAGGDDDAARAALIRRAVDCDKTAEPQARDVQVALDGFMRELEGWSVELQRTCPDDWNACIATIVRCLSGESPAANKGSSDKFNP